MRSTPPASRTPGTAEDAPLPSILQTFRSIFRVIDPVSSAAAARWSMGFLARVWLPSYNTQKWLQKSDTGTRVKFSSRFLSVCQNLTRFPHPSGASLNGAGGAGFQSLCENYDSRREPPREFTAHLDPVIPQSQRVAGAPSTRRSCARWGGSGAFWDCGISPKGPSPLPLRSCRCHSCSSSLGLGKDLARTSGFQTPP